MPQTVHIEGLNQTVHFPDGMTPAQIEKALENEVMPELRRLQPNTPQTMRTNNVSTQTYGQVKTPEPSQPPTFWESVQRGKQDLSEGIQQKLVSLLPDWNNFQSDEFKALADRVHGRPEGTTKARDEERRALGITSADAFTARANEGVRNYVERRGPDAGFDWGRLTGNVVGSAPMMVLPTGAPTVLARAGYGAMTGGALGAIQYDPTNSAIGNATNVVVGAGTGAVASPVLGFIGDKFSQALTSLRGRISGWLAEKAGQTTRESLEQAIPEAEALPPNAKESLFDEAIEQIRKSGTLNAEAMRRKANLLANGVTSTKAMVTRDPADWMAERNLQRIANNSTNPMLKEVGDELTGIYQANDKALASQIGRMQAPLPKGTQEQLGERAMRGIGNVAEQSQKAVRAGYEQVDNTFGNELASDARHVYETISDPNLMFNPRSRPLVEATRDYLKHMGMIDSRGRLTTNTLTASQNEKLRQFVNTLDDTFGRNQIIKAIDADAVSGLGQDVYGNARATAAARFETLDNPATQRALATLGELQQGKTAQNFIQSQIISGADQDIEALLKTIKPDPHALDAIQAGVLQHLERKAVALNSGQFSGTALNKAVTELGDKKLRLIFGDQGLAEIKSLARAALDSTNEPAYASVNHSNSATTLLPFLNGIRKWPALSQASKLVVPEELKASMEAAAARKRLASALQADSTVLPVNPRIKRLADALNATTTPSAVATVDNFRNKKKGGANDK